MEAIGITALVLVAAISILCALREYGRNERFLYDEQPPKEEEPKLPVIRKPTLSGVYDADVIDLQRDKDLLWNRFELFNKQISDRMDSLEGLVKAEIDKAENVLFDDLMERMRVSQREFGSFIRAGMEEVAERELKRFTEEAAAKKRKGNGQRKRKSRKV